MTIDLNEVDALSVPAALILGKLIKTAFPKHKSWTVHINSVVVAGVNAIFQSLALGVKWQAALLKGVVAGVTASGLHEASEPMMKKKAESEVS